MKNKFFSKNIVLSVIFLFVIVGIFILFKGTYSIEENGLASKMYSREEVQDMVVSTALSYLHNNRYTDYDKKVMDGGGATTTISWRNPRVSPEEASRTNIFSIDCSSFATITYKYSLGYNFSEYYGFYGNSTRYYVFNGDKQKFDSIKVNDSTTLLTRFNQYGRGLSGRFYTGITALSFGLNGVTYDNITNIDNNFIDTYDENEDNLEDKFKPYVDETGKEIGTFLYETSKAMKGNFGKVDDGLEEPNEVVKAYNEMVALLQPGDIITYINLLSDDNSPSGHTMVYVGDIFNIGRPGFIHSSGADYGKEDNGTWNIGDDLYSVRFDAMDRLSYWFENRNIILMAITRPINKYLSSIGNDLMILNSENIPINGNDRTAFKWIRTEQYATKTTSAINIEDNGKLVNLTDEKVNISKYNSINEGEKITYNLELENKSVSGYCTGIGGSYGTENECEDNKGNWITTTNLKEIFSNITVTAIVPENTKFVSCNLDCTREGNILSWKIDSLGVNALKTISYTVTVIGGEMITNEGMKIEFQDNTLQMGQLETKVNPTTNKLTVEKLKESINKFNIALSSGKITYNNKETTSYKVKIEQLNNAVFNSYRFVKNIYYDAFDIILDEISESNVRNAIFNKSSAAAVYAKKTEEEITKLAGNAAKINKMLVKGFYGGLYLKGNDNYDRPGRLRITDLEVGDIILFYTSSNSEPAASSSMYMYLGNSGMSDCEIPTENVIISGCETRATPAENDKLGVFITFNKDNTLKIIDSATSVTAHQFFNELWSKDLFVVLRPSQLYGTTVKYNNSTISGVGASFEYGTYKNLKDVKSNKTFTTILDYNNDEYNCTDCKTSFSGSNYFNGWFLEPERTKQVINGMDLLNSSTHTLYADWERDEFLLPQAFVNGDVIVGWYKDELLTKMVGYANTSHKIADGKNEGGASEFLYAKWENEVIYSQIDKCENIDDKLYCKINENTMAENFKDNIGVKPGYDSSVNYKNVNGNKLVYTGGKTKILRSWDDSDSVIIEYTNVVRGDTNGDGAVSVSDVSMMFQYYRGTNENVIDNISIMAGDVVKNDAEIKLTDVAKLFQFVNGKIDSLG